MHDNAHNANNAINEAIMQQYDRGVEARLEDLHMGPEYMKAPSCIGVVERIRGLAGRLGVKEGSREHRDLMKTVLGMAVPPGTKAAVRGNAFNKYVKGVLERALVGKEGWSVAFEEKHPEFSEIADWVVRGKGGRVIVGFNQLDVWGGGAQLNRAAKYIMDEALHRRLRKKGITVVCVVARRFVVRGRGKASAIVSHGVRTGRLLWSRGLKALVARLT